MYSDGLFLFVIAASLSAQAPPPTSSADLLPGRRIFEGQCAPCHGIHGEGGRGPTLHVSRLRHAPDDAALADLLQNGIPGTGMPGFFLSEGETAQVSAYVRGLGTQPAAPVSGDAARGRTVYQTAGCPTCHIAEGAGRALGPDLSEAGARRTTQGRTGTAMGVPGDNLYTGSLLALRAEDGALQWHFQFTPHDDHDWDATEIPVLFEDRRNGRARKQVAMANRNAF